jgi:hypothetical protein
MAQVVRLGGSARWSGLPRFKRTPPILGPGRPVDLRNENGAWRQGFRTLSEPWTAETGEVMIWVAEPVSRVSVRSTFGPTQIRVGRR